MCGKGAVRARKGSLAPMVVTCGCSSALARCELGRGRPTRTHLRARQGVRFGLHAGIAGVSREVSLGVSKLASYLRIEERELEAGGLN
jgi:hypothetical protein